MATAQQKPPYPTYAALVGIFGLGMSGLAAIAACAAAGPSSCARSTSRSSRRRRSRPPGRSPTTRSRASSASRSSQGEAHEGDERPVEDGGTRQAIGELLTCSRCIGMWAAAGVVGLHTVAPRSGRLLTWSLAAAAANDFLQAGFSALTSKANELERRAP